MQKRTWQALNRGDATFYAVHYWYAAERFVVTKVGGHNAEEAARSWERNRPSGRHKLIAIFADEYVAELAKVLWEHKHSVPRVFV